MMGENFVETQFVETQIDRVLESLNETRPRAAMEARILARVEQRAAGREPARQRGWMWVGPLAAAMVVVVVMVSVRETRPSAPPLAVARQVSEARPAEGTAATPILRVTGKPARMLNANAAMSLEPAAPAKDSAVLDKLARAEMEAPSTAFPRQSLTRDERALREALRRGEYVDLARATPAEAAPDVAALFARFAFAAMSTAPDTSNETSTATQPAQEPEHESQ